jgi:hypothetical protein
LEPKSRLSYGERLPWRKRTWFRRARVALVLAGPLVAGIWWARTQGPVLWWQHCCLVYSAPPDRLVYDDEPTAGWLASAVSPGGQHPVLVPVPHGRASLPVGLSPTARRVDLVALEDRLRGGSTPTPLAIFMHARTGRDGKSRLVSITAAWADLHDDNYCLVLGRSTCQTASAIPGSAMEELILPYAAIVVPRGKRLQLFAGQIDPSDTSRFTIAYSLGGVPGVIEGTYVDTTVSGLPLSARSGPAEVAGWYSLDFSR